MAVTITGSASVLAAGGLHVDGRTGTVELVPMHPSGMRPQYGFTGSVLTYVEPLNIALSAGGAIPGSTTILASGALQPDGCFYRVTWRIGGQGVSDGTVEVVEYDCWIGPDGGSCVITDPLIRLQHAGAPVIAGWPETPPVIVYGALGTP